MYLAYVTIFLSDHGIFIDMNRSPLEDHPNHWRARAEQTPAKADQIWRDVNKKRSLLRAAEEYDRLARRAEQWQSAYEAQGRAAG